MGDGKRPVTSPQPGNPPAAPIQPQPILISRVLEVGPPLVPRQKPPEPAQNPQPKSAAAGLNAIPPIEPPPPRAARPQAPVVTVTETTSNESLWDSVEALLDDVDAGFGAIIDAPGNAPGAAGVTTREEEGPRTRRDSGGLSSARELFLQLATAHLRHVRDFMIDVKSGQATSEWLQLCDPAIQSVKQMADQLELQDLVASLGAYSDALKFAGENAGMTIDPESASRLLAAYDPLVALIPSAFSLDAVKSRRDGVIVHALLLQIPAVRKVTIDKLFAAGLTTLDAFYVARAEEIAVATGIDADLAKKIAERFAAYKKENQSQSVDEERSVERKRLAVLVDELGKAHEAFERAEKDDDNKKKRDARKARENALLEIKVLLARLGEEERATAIDKVPFSQKVAELRKLVAG